MEVPGLEPANRLSRVYVPLRDRAREGGVTTLSDIERHVLVAYRFLTTHPTGYLNGFLTSHPESANYLSDALAAIGASTASKLCTESLSLFPGGRFPEDEDEAWELRSDIAESSPKSWLDLEAHTTQLHDELIAKLEEYVDKHRSALPSADIP